MHTITLCFVLTLVATSDDVKSTGVSRLIYYPYESTIAVTVGIIDDELVEGTEAFGVQLIVPDHHKANGVKLGNPSLATVFIRDGMYVKCVNFFINIFVMLHQMTRVLLLFHLVLLSYHQFHLLLVVLLLYQ